MRVDPGLWMEFRKLKGGLKWRLLKVWLSFSL